jgi:hypothetical protein
MKIVRTQVQLRQGLPNYSHREVVVEAVADEGESLDIAGVVREITAEIKEGFKKDDVASPPPIVEMAKQAVAETKATPKVTKAKAQAATAKDDLGF